jgi:hypothetical protein
MHENTLSPRKNATPPAFLGFTQIQQDAKAALTRDGLEPRALAGVVYSSKCP